MNSKKVKKSDANLDRRNFLIGSASAFGGLVIGTIVNPKVSMAKDIDKQIAKDNFSLFAWFTLHKNGKVTMQSPWTDLGTHMSTTHAQILADAMDLNWDDMIVGNAEMPNLQFGNTLMAAGSMGVMFYYMTIMQVGLATRALLLENAASYLGVDVKTLSASKGVIKHKSTGNTITYGQVVEHGIKPKMISPLDLQAIQLKQAGFTTIGKSIPAADSPDKIRGKAKYGIDLKLPGMIYATPIVPPTRSGCKVKKDGIDDSAAKKIKGYIASIPVPPFPQCDGYVLVFADTLYHAFEAAKKVKVTYEASPSSKIDNKSLYEISKKLANNPGKGLLVNTLDGDPDKSYNDEAIKHEAEYASAMILHGQMEPCSLAAAWDKKGHLHTYGAFQWPQGLQDFLYKLVFKLKEDQMHFHTMPCGGAFGRRLYPDLPLLPAFAAAAMKRPVNVVFSREADFQLDQARPPAVMPLKGAGNKKDGITSWQMMTATGAVFGWFGQPGLHASSFDPDTESLGSGLKRGAFFPLNKALNTEESTVIDESSFGGFAALHAYVIPNFKVEAVEVPEATKMVPGWQRVVSNAYETFAVECFMDEMAHKIGIDPLALRLKHLINKGRGAPYRNKLPWQGRGFAGLAKVLKKAAKAAGYGSKLPKNTAFGIGCSTGIIGSYMPTYGTCIVKVEVDPSTGEFIVHKITQAFDIGVVVNPDGAKAQAMGGAVMGIGHAIMEEAEVKNGLIQSSNYDSYLVPRMSDVPEIETIIIGGPYAPTGIGEFGVTGVAPAIANAIHSAVGARVRDLPITPEKVLAALKNKKAS